MCSSPLALTPKKFFNGVLTNSSAKEEFHTRDGEDEPNKLHERFHCKKMGKHNINRDSSIDKLMNKLGNSPLPTYSACTILCVIRTHIDL